jgi:hypothetical protein
VPAELSLRALNRATLDRQLLLRRADIPLPDLIEHLVGLQAQTPHTWYHGAWCRLERFAPQELSALLEARQVVRVALMRSTIHLVTARDCLALRPVLQPVVDRWLSGTFGRRLAGLDLDEVASTGAGLLAAEPMIFSELGRRLAERWPDRDPEALAQAVRGRVSLVQVTPRGLWGRSGKAAHAPASVWLSGVPAPAPASVDDLVLRYLGAFGPASVRDAQTWSGLTRLAEVFERLPLVRLRDPEGREVFDLPDAPRPGDDAPAPVRFLYDFDNLLLSHADRSRVITDGYRHQGFEDNGPMPRCFLVDGFTAGTWTVSTTRTEATLIVQPFARLSKKDSAAVAAEGQLLLDYAAPSVPDRDIRVVRPGPWHALKARSPY